jgi:hypothetical protein
MDQRANEVGEWMAGRARGGQILETRKADVGKGLDCRWIMEGEGDKRGRTAPAGN